MRHLNYLPSAAAVGVWKVCSIFNKLLYDSLHLSRQDKFICIALFLHKTTNQSLTFSSIVNTHLVFRSWVNTPAVLNTVADSAKKHRERHNKHTNIRERVRANDTTQVKLRPSFIGSTGMMMLDYMSHFPRIPPILFLP